MPYEMFWHGTLQDYVIFQLKHINEEKERIEAVNWGAWLQGTYIKNALEACYQLYNGMIDGKKAKPFPYPKEPVKLFKNEKTEEELQQHEDVCAAIKAHNMRMAAFLHNKSNNNEAEIEQKGG